MNCAICEANNARKIEKPLNVIWLCRKHHDDVHRFKKKNRGII